MKYIEKKSIIELPFVVDNIAYNYVNKIKNTIMKILIK